MNKKIIKINASSLPWLVCKLKWYHYVVEGYKEPLLPAKVVYGIAVHRFIDTIFKTSGNVGLAMEAGQMAFNMPKIPDRKSLHINDVKHLTGTCFQYWSCVLSKESEHELLLLPMEGGKGKPATEVTFSILYYEDSVCEIWLEGTIDKLVKIKNGCFAIGDYKTTSNGYPDIYLDKYSMSHQLRFYVTAVKLMAEKYPDSMLGQIGKTKIGAFIDGIFIRPSFSDNIYRRSDVFQFSDNDLMNYRTLLDTQIHKLIDVVKNPIPPLKEGLLTGACAGDYGCAFMKVCRADNPQIESALLKRDFVVKEYNPMKHND